MEIRLIVIRTPDIERLSKFYTLFGLTFDYHKHDKSPYHFSTTVDKTVIEIYPLSKSQTQHDKSLRLGFSIDNFEYTIDLLKHEGIVFTSEVAQSEFGIMAVIEDPDGRKIELYKT